MKMAARVPDVSAPQIYPAATMPVSYACANCGRVQRLFIWAPHACAASLWDTLTPDALTVLSMHVDACPGVAVKNFIPSGQDERAVASVSTVPPSALAGVVVKALTIWSGDFPQAAKIRTKAIDIFVFILHFLP